MTELTDLNDTDALNTEVSSQSTEGNVANMGGMDNLFQATLGMLSRFRNANIFRLRDNTDKTKLLAFDLSGLTTATTRTLTVADGSGTIVTSGAMALSDAAKLQVRTNIGSPWLVSYDSGEQTITSGGFLTLTHGLGGVPSLLFAVLRCKTAEHNYAVGDEIPALVNESADWGCIPVLRSGTIVILYGTKAQVFVAKDTTSRSGVLLTNANWRLIVRAYL